MRQFRSGVSGLKADIEYALVRHCERPIVADSRLSHCNIVLLCSESAQKQRTAKNDPSRSVNVQASNVRYEQKQTFNITVLRNVMVVRDGAEALDFIFGFYSG